MTGATVAKQPLHTELALWLHKMAGHVGRQEFAKLPIALTLVLERDDGTHDEDVPADLRREATECLKPSENLEGNPSAGGMTTIQPGNP